MVSCLMIQALLVIRLLRSAILILNPMKRASLSVSLFLLCFAALLFAQSSALTDRTASGGRLAAASCSRLRKTYDDADGLVSVSNASCREPRRSRLFRGARIEQTRLYHLPSAI